MSTGSSSRKSSKKRTEEKTTQSAYLRSVFFCGLGFGITMSMILFYGIAYIVGMPVLLRDTVVLQAYALVFSLIIYTVLAVLLWLPGSGIDLLLRKRGKAYNPLVIYTIALSIPTFLWIFMTMWIVIDRPFEFTTPWFIPAVIAFCVVGFFAGILFKDTALGIRRIFRGGGRLKMVRNIFLVLCVPLFISAAVHLVMGLRDGRSGEIAVPSALIEGTDTKLVIIGLDGATWDIMDKMIARGELPNIKFLMDNGSYGPLASNVSVTQAFASSASMGMRSPALWETIATGKSEKKHGIMDFSVMRTPFMRSDIPFRIPVLEDVLEIIPTTSTVGRSLRFWDILSRAGLEVGVLGWWNMWPVTPIENGYLISSRIKWDIPNAAYPPDFLEDYPKKMSFTAEKAGKLFLNWWEGLDRDNLMGIIERSTASLNFESFRRHFNRDNRMAALSVLLMEKHPTPLFATYFQGPDFVCHLFWKYMEPSLFREVREEEARLFGDIIFKYYSFLDEVVGKHVEADSLDATYMILSDHGFGVWQEGETDVIRDMYHPTYTGKHRENGIIILAGKNIKRGGSFSDANIFDITPTILTLMGMPVAIDMDGRSLVEVLEESFLEEHPVRYVNTYETGEKRIPAAVSSSVDEEIKERLRALGYMK
jgi:predicted AlkP superfamily phosphohydrolase/phosphomutase